MSVSGRHELDQIKWATCHSCGSDKVESCPVPLAPGRKK